MNLVFAILMLAATQPAPQEKTAGEAMKNVQVLKDIPASELTNVMYFVAGSLGVSCQHCHVAAFDADTKAAKQTARRMMQMVRDINAASFGGKPVVTCNTCHRGSVLPQGVPSLWNKTPDEIAAYKQQLQNDREGKPASSTAAEAGIPESLPTAKQVFEKYRQAVGDAPFKTLHLAATIAGDLQPSQVVEYDVIFPDKLAVHLALPGGAAQNIVIDGDRGWATTRAGTRDVDPGTIAAMKGNQLIQSIKFPELETSGQVTGTEKIGDRTYTVVESRTPKFVRRLYFDSQSGLLYKTQSETRVATFGVSPAETIFEGYRDVSGVKVPFSILGITTADRIRTTISELRANSPIDPAKFERLVSGRHVSRRISSLLLVASAVTGSVWAADDPFVGKWKLNPSKSVLTDEMKIEAVGANKYTFTLGPGQVDTIVTDGTDQPALQGTTLSVTVEAPSKWKVVRKLNGRTLLTAYWTLSEDGKTLNDAFTQYLPDGTRLFSQPLPNGSTLFMPYVYERTAGNLGFVGTWDSESAKAPARIELQIQSFEGDGLSFKRSDEERVERITFDGKDRRRVNERRLEITEKSNGEITGTRQIELSSDLKTLTVTSHLLGQNRPQSILVYDRE